MRIFVAGASGAIGRPLITELIRQGHTVIGMTQSDQGAKKLIELGADVERANAFDPSAVARLGDKSTTRLFSLHRVRRSLSSCRSE
jgi:2-alkyl-3-oxoalkanoate reductase